MTPPEPKMTLVNKKREEKIGDFDIENVINSDKKILRS